MSPFAKLLLEAKSAGFKKLSFIADLTTLYPRVSGSVEGADNAWMCVASNKVVVYRAVGRTGEEALRCVLEKKGKDNAASKG